MSWLRTVVCLVLAVALVGCAGTSTRARVIEASIFATPPSDSDAHDTPVPKTEPRETLHATLDLHPVADCERRFDSALYEHDGVDVVAWDDRRGCVGRDVSLRYFPRRLARPALFRLVNQHALRVLDDPE